MFWILVAQTIRQARYEVLRPASAQRPRIPGAIIELMLLVGLRSLKCIIDDLSDDHRESPSTYHMGFSSGRSWREAVLCATVIGGFVCCNPELSRWQATAASAFLWRSCNQRLVLGYLVDLANGFPN
jgi:hypothetical protein